MATEIELTGEIGQLVQSFSGFSFKRLGMSLINYLLDYFVGVKEFYQVCEEFFIERRLFNKLSVGTVIKWENIFDWEPNVTGIVVSKSKTAVEICWLASGNRESFSKKEIARHLSYKTMKFLT